MGEDPPTVVSLTSFITQWRLREGFLADKTWSTQGGIEFNRLAHAGHAFVAALRTSEIGQLSGAMSFDGNQLRDGYSVFLPLGGYMLDGEYRDEPELVILPPRAKFYPEVLPETFALLIGPGPYDTEVSVSRTSLSLPELGLDMALHGSVVSAAEARQDHNLTTRTTSDGTHIYVKAYQRDTAPPRAHTNRRGGECLLLLAGSVQDGRQTFSAGHLCVNGPRTVHAPMVVDHLVAMTLDFGPADPYEQPTLSTLRGRANHS